MNWADFWTGWAQIMVVVITIVGTIGVLGWLMERGMGKDE